MSNKFVVLIGEDELCMAMLKKLVEISNPELCIKYEIITRGFGNIKAGIPKYIQASNIFPHIILTDLDQHACPIELINDWQINHINKQNLIFRVAVREAEAWLLADRNGFANFLGVDPQVVPPYPENVGDPKQFLLNLVKHSKKRSLSKDLLPTKSSTATIGTLYNERLTEFVFNSWDVPSAALNSESLNKAITRIKEINAN